MARLDPHAFPDRFALDRYARRMRSDETAHAAAAAVQGLRAATHHLSDLVRKAAANVAAHAHSTHTPA